MYRELVNKRLSGLQAGSPSAWNELIRLLSIEPHLRLAGDNVNLEIDNKASDDADCHEASLKLAQNNPNSAAQALFISAGDVTCAGRMYGAIRPAHAVGLWKVADSTSIHPYVMVVDDWNGEIVQVALPRTNSGGDPNVRRGNPVFYAYDADQSDGVPCHGNPVCVSDYMDCMIGMIKGWKRPLSELPGGWQLLGTIGGNPSAGRVLVQYDATDPDYDILGESGGTKTHTHTFDDHTIALTELDMVTDVIQDGCFFQLCTTQICVLSGLVGTEDCG